MQKRRLTKDEISISERSIKRMENEIESFKQDLEYSNDLNSLNEKWVDYLKKRDEEIRNKNKTMLIESIRAISQEIEFRQKNIEILRDQIKTGVEKKKEVNYT